MKIPVIFGPTASGKTKLASILLEKSDKIHFIVADSRKIYRYMDIGTNKPPENLRNFFSMIDIRDPDEHFSAADFAKLAEIEIKKIISSGKIPVIIGGTVLYLKALFEGLFEAPPIDKEIRENLRIRLKSEGIRNLFEELKKLDPEAASRIHPNDWFRILRALEVYYQTGKTITHWQREKNHKKTEFYPIYFGLYRSRENLYQRINQRFDRMMDAGFLDEVKRLLAMGYTPDLPSLNTIGYKELIQYLLSEISLERAILISKRRTRILARRQIYFSRSLKPPVKWISVENDYKDILDQLKTWIA